MSENQNEKRQSVFRTVRRKNYTIIGRETIEDNRLTFEARGLLCFLLAKPDDWVTRMTHLIKSSPAGKHKIRRMVDKLIRYGYVVRLRDRNEHGRFASTVYQVYDEPQSDFREVDNQEAGKREAENRPLLSKQYTKYPNNKKTTTTSDSSLSEELIWPEGFDNQTKRSVLDLIDRDNIVVVQDILDEISGMELPPRNPVGYFFRLLQLSRENKFVPANAVQLQEKRRKLEQAELRYQQVLKQSEEAIMKEVRKQQL